MSPAAEAASSDDDALQELSRLVPGRSWVETVLIVVLSLAAVVTAWVAPATLSAWAQPQWTFGMWGQAGSGTVSSPLHSYYVVAHTDYTNSRDLTLLGINGIRGARVTASWVVPADGPDDAAFWSAWDSVAGSNCDETAECGNPPGILRSADATTLIRALTAAGAPLDRTALPHTMRQGDRLYVLWQVTDCAAAAAVYDSETPLGPWGHPIDPLAGASIQGPLGTIVHQTSVVATPFDFGVQWLEDYGRCPA